MGIRTDSRWLAERLAALAVAHQDVKDAVIERSGIGLEVACLEVDKHCRAIVRMCRLSDPFDDER